ncbi:MAG: hypothetical protein KJO98_01085, partial [Rhodothermia bacterium]|nr:hypothetical protein [Rhodothermia bacterium]
MLRKITSVAVACLLWSGLSAQVHAQDVDRRLAEELFRSDVRDVLSREDKSLAIEARRQGNYRVDVRNGVRRASYAISARVAPAATPVDAARSYLADARDAYGLAEAGDLELV